MGLRVLLVDGDQPRGLRLSRSLERRGLLSAVASTVTGALASLREGGFSSVIAFRSSDADALEACRRISAEMPRVPVVVVATESSPDWAVEALRGGAADYVPAPADPDAVAQVVQRVLARESLRDHLKTLRAAEPSSDPIGARFCGASAAIDELRARVGRVAQTDVTLLVTGESGTGKGLVARTVHDCSRRREGPFVAIDCASIPDQLAESELFGFAKGTFTGAGGGRAGLLSQANGGTVFLDEVASMSLGTQAKLLRALQEKSVRPLGEATEVPFDARVIAATNADLEAGVHSGAFRKDLLFRLNVVGIRVPALRERREDVLLLAQRYIERFAAAASKRVIGMTPGAARALLAHDWPGNVRELGNWMEAAVLNARYDHITELDLPAIGSRDAVSSEPRHTEIASLEHVEKEHMEAVLRSVGGNKSHAARILGLDRKTLARKLKG